MALDESQWESINAYWKRLLEQMPGLQIDVGLSFQDKAKIKASGWEDGPPFPDQNDPIRMRPGPDQDLVALPKVTRVVLELKATPRQRKGKRDLGPGREFVVREVQREFGSPSRREWRYPLLRRS